MMDGTAAQRQQLWDYLIPQLEQYAQHTDQLPVAPELNKNEIAGFVQKYHFDNKLAPETAIAHVIEGLTRYAVHTPHPMYYGLFNPRPSFASVLADTITAVFNPQLAAWSHAPFANETETFLLRAFGQKFGYTEADIDGNFTSGGQEANLTAVLCALNHHFPGFARQGLRDKPVIYTSADCHHSIMKSAGITGLGMQAVRVIPTNAQLQMNTDLLVRQIEQDRRESCRPFLIVANMGATGTGVIDPIDRLADIARQYQCWLHADAAYGGAVALHGQYRSLLGNIAAADSITFDAHKWLSVPMAAGMFITRHPQALRETFAINADYMPKDAAGLDVTDPFTHSMQWSRRFIGLKVYLSLLMYGWEGMAELVAAQIEKGDFLRKKLLETGWDIYNPTALPVVCFGKKGFETDSSLALRTVQRLLATGKAWVSVYRIGERNSIRACMTNFQTSESDIEQLVELLNENLPAS